MPESLRRPGPHHARGENMGKAKKTSKVKKCPECGTEVQEPYKTWELVAPFPAKKMRITVTIMGMYECPNCGKKFRAVVSKVKLGPGEVEISK